MNLKEYCSIISHKVSHALHTSRGKDILLYLLFVCVAFVFWVLLSLDTEVQREYDIPISIENKPDSVVFISKVPKTVNVSVQSKGSQLLPYSWGRIPTAKFNFADYLSGENLFNVSHIKMEARLRDYFGSSVIVNSVRPDSMTLCYTTYPGVHVSVVPDMDIEPNLQCIISGNITVWPDSVKAYTINGHLPKDVSFASTERIVRHNMKDTTVINTRLKPVNGVRFIPDRVRIMIPVEPLIAKHQSVRVEVTNLPQDIDVITFPSKVDVSYLVPMSKYNAETSIKAIVDYSEIDPAFPTVSVSLSLIPEYVRNISVSPQSLEYVVEHQQR